MKMLTLMRLIFAGLAMVSLTTYASADTWNQKTRITINETIEVPGATLTPGTYIVKLADSNSNRHIVRFFNADETKVITTILAIPNERMRATGDSKFTFYEMPIGSHPALRAWFYPGRLIGQQFVYPKTRAMEIANTTGMYVPSMADESNKYMSDQREDDKYFDEYRRSDVTAYGKENQLTTYEDAVAKNESLAQSTPAQSHDDWMEFDRDTDNRSTTTIAQNRPNPQQYASNELPRTASDMPLLLLLATLLIGGGFAVRRVA